MSRLLVLFLAGITLTLGCQKDPAATAPKAAPKKPVQVSAAEDQLMQEYLTLMNDYIETLEKKIGGEALRNASSVSSAKFREIQSLTQERQKALQDKYQEPLDAMRKRLKDVLPQ